MLKSPHVFPPPHHPFILFGMVTVMQWPVTYFFAAGWIWQGILYGQLVAIGVTVSCFLWWQRPHVHFLFPWHRPHIVTAGVVIGMTLFFAYLTHTGVEWTKALFHAPPLFEEQYPELIRLHTWRDGLGKVSLLVLIPALCEEVYFRGVCQTIFARAYGPRVGLMLAAALFALSHGNLHYFPLYLLLGGYLGYLRYRGGSLTWPVLGHAINNAWTLWYHNGNL
ncbi:MAG: CPBP family intramembrane metalloprotease [Deltaproteobacteria bacterium]|nr:CPBP family intramembrane metalloprotease [Deltaproteobacteria bacterium]